MRRATAVKRPRWWIVPEIEKWFRGERDMPISALTFPFSAQLPELWAAWIEVYPDAVRPVESSLAFASGDAELTFRKSSITVIELRK